MAAHERARKCTSSFNGEGSSPEQVKMDVRTLKKARFSCQENAGCSVSAASSSANRVLKAAHVPRAKRKNDDKGFIKSF